MPHRYQALLINCMDPRLQGQNAIAIAKAAGLRPGEYEELAYAGPSLWITKPHQKIHRHTFWWLLDHISLKIHGISAVVLVGHSECGGLALKGAPKDFEKEKALIVDSLRQAKRAIASRHPELRVILVLVKIKPSHRKVLPPIECELVE